MDFVTAAHATAVLQSGPEASGPEVGLHVPGRQAGLAAQAYVESMRKARPTENT